MSVKRNINCKIYFHPCLIFRSWVSPRPVSLPPFPWSRNASRVWLRRLTSRGHSTQPTNIHTWREQTKHTFRHHPKLHITIYKKKTSCVKNHKQRYPIFERLLSSQRKIDSPVDPKMHLLNSPPNGGDFIWDLLKKLFCLQTIHYIWVLTIKTRSK